MALRGGSQQIFTTVCCFLLLGVAGTRTEVCAKDDLSSKCQNSTQADMDVNELMQMRIRVGSSSLSPESSEQTDYAQNVQEEKLHINVMREPYHATCNVDGLGLIENAGFEEHDSSAEEASEDSDILYDGSEYSSASDYDIVHPELQPYPGMADEMAHLDEIIKAEVEMDAWAEEHDDENVEEHENMLSDQEITENAMKEAAQGGLHNRKRKMKDLPPPPAFLRTEEKVTRVHLTSSGALRTDKIFDKYNCNHKYKQWIGPYEDPICAQKVFDKGFTYYLISTKMGWKHCEAIKTAFADCPDGQSTHNDLATYRVYEDNKPIVFDMYPRAGSVAGGQLVTFRGAFLYEAHDKMEGKKDTASALKAPVQIFMTDKSGLNISLECPLENFESRLADVKCVTPPLSTEQMLIADQELYIMILKLSGTGVTTVKRPKADDIDKVISYKYSTGATPELASVSPVSVGPGQVLTLHGLSCSGIVEGDPVQLVKILTANSTGLPNNSDAESSELVPDPQTAFGHICDPWPPLSERKNFSSANKEILKSEADSDFGAIGLDAMEFKLKNLQEYADAADNLEKWISKQNILEAARWIQPKPWLDHRKYWRNKKHRYVAKLSGKMSIDKEGYYEFLMETLRIGYFKFDGKLVKGTQSHNKGTKARWGHHGKIIARMMVKEGMHKVEWAHAVNMDHPHNSALYVKYKGPDTGNQWQKISENRLRAGITREAINTLEQTRLATLDHQEKYLVAAKEVLGSMSKGIGQGTCPSGAKPKLVEFKCKVSEDMEPGFYDVRFQDHEYGESVTPKKAQWLNPSMTMVTMSVLPIIKGVGIDSDGKITVEGHGLDHLQDSDVTFNGYKYEKLNTTQDVIELLPGNLKTGDAVEMGARGLLREYWYDYKYPEELEAKGDVPAWARASKLKTNIMSAPGHESKGFSERLTGLLVPPFSGECRWKMKGNPGANKAKLFFNEVPMSEQTEVVDKPKPPAQLSPFLYYAGRSFTGASSDYENLYSAYKGADMGGAMSIAVTTKFAKSMSCCNNRVFDWGKGPHSANIFVSREHNRRHLYFRIHQYPGGHYTLLRAYNVIRYDETQNWLFTVNKAGMMRIYLEGVLVAQHTTGIVPPKVSRPKMYVAKSNWNDKNFKGEIKHLRVYEGVAKWGQVYAEAKDKQVNFKTVRYGVQCEGHGDKDLGWKRNQLECAKEAKKQGYKFFRLGKYNRYGKCYGEQTDECDKFWHTSEYDVYQVMEAESPTEPIVQLLPFPADPAVETTDMNTKDSSYFTFKAGKAYPFKLERKVQMLTEDTGPTGWSKLGLECRSINGTEAGPELGDGFLPKAVYSVEVKFKEYSVALKLPKSKDGYTVKFKDHSEEITQDSGAGRKFAALFGPKCTTSATKTGGTIAFREEFDDTMSSDSYCGSGRFAAPLDSKGVWTKDRVHINVKDYKLKDKKWLHMCYKIAPMTRVNMIVRCKVGYRGRSQTFSIGMTDGLDNPNSYFHHDYKRAAQWPLKIVNGTTSGTWECASINLYQQVTSFESYERRFHDIYYHYANSNPGHSRAPGPMLHEMTITDLYIGTARWQHPRFVRLEGESYFDTIVASSAEFAVSRKTFAFNAPLPWSNQQGLDTSSGWKVEWFTDSGFLWKPGTKGSSYDKKVLKVTTMNGLWLDGCKVGQPEIGDCYHYGWRAKTTIDLPGNKKIKFWYQNDDNLEIFVNEKSIGRMGCCTRGDWKRYRSYTTGAAGSYRLEVHLWQGGGGNYGGLAWEYDGKRYKVPTAAGSAGVTKNHELLFKPVSRGKIGELKEFLEKVEFIPKKAGETFGELVKYSPGPPAAPVMMASSPPPPMSFTPALMVGFDGADMVLRTKDDKTKFNAMFAACPVVKYYYNGKVWGIYRRIKPIGSFDAYENFVNTWRSKDNKINEHFQIFSNEDDLALGKKPWTFCNYDYNTIGFPRDCGPTGAVGGKWFRHPDRGGPSNPYDTFGFEIQTGDSCASPLGSAYKTPNTVSFEMNSTDAAISQKISSLGVPVQVTVLNLDGIRWMDMRSMTAQQSSRHYHGYAKYAIDGQPTKIDWNEHSCTHTQRDKTSWWSVNLGKTVNIAKVRIAGRNCCSNQVRDATIAIDGKPCHTGLQINDKESKEVTCFGTGSTMSVYFPSKQEHLSICEFQVGTFDGAEDATFGADTSTFGFQITYDATGYMPAPSFTSPLADKIVVKSVSSGTRFLSDITDAFFRVPHGAAQVTFNPWGSYICETNSTKGCAPVLVPTPPGNVSNGSKMSLLQRGALERITTHNRRHALRKWRLPPRFHTEETLEKMRRRVFGYAKNVKGWSETSSLLQMHAGHQKHFETIDPRDDPKKLSWSDPKSWGGDTPPNKDTTDIVYIPEGKTALLDMNVNIRFWVIEGNVVWDMNKDIHMEAEAIVVNGGQLLIGSEKQPYAQKGQITLHGHWHTFKLPLCGAKTIFQTRGNIEMHGIPIPTTWTELETTAFPEDMHITVYGDLSNDWKPGNKIVIAASDRLVMDCRLDRRDNCQVEERYITWIEKGIDSTTSRGGPTTTIILDRPLVYRHLAEELDAYFSDEYCTTKGLDQRSCAMTQIRAEVGLLTRNIVVKGSNYHDGSGPAGSEGFGGHLMHAEKAKYSYIEFFWMGQAFQMGRYPLHLHLTGLNPSSYIKGCAIHRTFMRGVTVHGTHSATIKDNVLYNVMAHGYFIEDGNEHNNLFENNLGMMVHKSFSALVSDQTPAVFWLRNPSNYFRNNHAAGGASFGFWFDTLGQAAHLGIKQFENNTAHSNGNTGIWIDIVDPRKECNADSEWTIKVPARDSDEVSRPEHDKAPNCGGKHRTINELKHITTWGNGAFGITLFETGHFHLVNHRSIQDPTGILVWGVQSDNWPDETNGFNGPTLLHGVYSTVSGLPSNFRSGCSIGGPWDDTLLVYGAQFIGPVNKGHFCPCFECLAMEGGYETRTAKLGWHKGAGTPDSVRAKWPWLYASNFFDIDGTLTEDTMDCRFHGCYLHAPFNGDRAGMYSRRTTSDDQIEGGGGGGSGGGGAIDNGLMQEDNEESFIEADSDDGFLAEIEGDDIVEEAPDPFSFVDTEAETQELVECRGSLYSKIKPDNITSNRYNANRDSYGKGQMWRSGLYFEGDPTYCGHRRSDDYIEYDLGEPTWVTGVQTRGRANHDQWVTKYKVQYTENGITWSLIDKDFIGNADRNTIKENRFQPIKATKIRLVMKAWRSHNCMRLDFIGCDGKLPLTMTCVDSPYLDPQKRNCAALERKLGAKKMQEWCKTDAAGIAMHTALSAKQACCACGAGVNVVAQDIAPKKGSNGTTDVPDDAPVKVVPGGTGYFDPKYCKMIDATGGVVCLRATRMNSITVKSAGIWHMMTPIDVQSDFGFAEIKLAFCYQQYEFTVMTGNRYLLVPPYTPKMLVDWDMFDAEIKMSAGDKYVLQWETIHNPDGYTVEMDNVHKKSICDEAEMQYDSNFNNNQTLLDILKSETDLHSVQKLKLSKGFIFDMYKVAHLPLLDRAEEAQSAGMWGYIQANESYDFRYWYPGMFNVLITEKGVSYSSNYLGPWDGHKKHPNEQWPTRNLNNKKEAASFGFSQLKTPMKWKRWDLALPPPPGQKPPPQIQMSRLRFLVTYCGFNPASFGLYSDAAAAAVAKHEDVTKGLVKVPAIRKFKWSQWPKDLGGKPKLVDNLGGYGQGYGNVSIEANWEVTLDEDVDFINKLNISGVLKFEDKAGCCKIVARYIFVGPLFGKIEAGTESAPFSQGVAHIVLKGQPMTPPLRHFRPHIWGSAKWLKSKFLAVQGSLSLHGKTRSKTWVKIAKSVSKGAASIVVDGGDFKVGDVVALNDGGETKKITKVAGSGSGTIPGLMQTDANASGVAETTGLTTLTFDSPLQKDYRGADFVYNNRAETAGWMAGYVGLVDGYNVIVEGEDTEGVPMCHKSKTQKCPYANGLGGGMNLHDFAKEMRHYLEKTGAAQHPNCRPCLAVSEMAFAGYIIGMAHFHYFKKCPKDHGVIDVTGVAFKHGSQMRLYHGFTGGNYPDDLASMNFAAAWSGQPYAWWKDPVWAELKLSDPPVPAHQIAFSAFNNTHTGGAFALTNAGVQVFPTKPVHDNVILSGAVGINGAARPMKDIGAYSLDLASPVNDNFDTMTEGVGAPTDFGTFGYKGRHTQGTSDFSFSDNLLIGATLTNFRGAGGNRVVTNNVILAPVYLDGCPTTSGSTCFANNVVNSPSTSGCVMMRSSGKAGIADNTVFGCRIAIAFNWFTNREGTVRRMKILDSQVGIHYWANGPDSKAHDKKREEFEVTDSVIYSMPGGGGVGIRNPKVHSNLLGQPVPDWWHGGTNFFPMGHAAPCLFFKSMLSGIKFVGYQKTSGGAAITVGEGHQGDTSDADYHPMFTMGLSFEDMNKESYMRFRKPSSMGNSGVRACLQIDCDGRRNSLLVDQDGSLMGSPGTVVSMPHKFYDKMNYVDPMGFDTMEDLIPMPARYDAVGDAIPFPTGVDHGHGGGLEYECQQDGGCAVLYMHKSGDMAGMWIPHENQTIDKGEKIVAIREDGGHIFLDPLHHGWDYATGTVKTEICKKTMDPLDSKKPESQHARRYGRVAAGAFGSHLNASKIPATVGPVYTVPGIYRKGCTFNSHWESYECPKGRHRHLLIEVMDWNHMVRRWAPVTVEVNDQYAPQGGSMNVLTGPAMYWTSPMMRLQSFHALGHVGMRHNVYFSADPPSHLRLHLQYAAQSEGVIVCVYYGLPNMIQAYVGGAKKPPMITPTWDNLVFAYLNTSMAHGTYYYDRIGVETLRPGYLYAIIKGDQHADFKISHKVVLTSKVTVTADWGGWKNDDGGKNDKNNNFYKKGINGLVRNIALLIGAPPNKVAILGQGKAKKGTFWNSNTTSEEFAKWMWDQNKSMDRKTMKEWKNTPGAKLKNNSKAPNGTSFLQVSQRHASFLEQFSEERRSIIAEALVQEGPGADTWYHKMSLLSSEEVAMVHERRVSDMLERQGEVHHSALRLLQESTMVTDEDDDDNDTITVIYDSDSDVVPATINSDQEAMKDSKLLEQHDKHVTQLKTEDNGMKILENCVPNGTSTCTLPSENGTFDIQSASTDHVPTKNNPKGWLCEEVKYNDGQFCDCDCGIWDPDCDLKSHVRTLDPVILNSTDSLLLLDREQARMAIKWVDKNFNTMIDAEEILKVPTLGLSSLYSMAKTIVQAMEMGGNKQDGYSFRRGDFAWMEAVTTSSCNKLLADAPLSPKLATYTAKCVKDDVFGKTLSQPTGRCSIQPKMQIGSQCHVPGGGFFPAPASGTNSSTDESICGSMLKIFKGGLGAGGTMSAGVGPSSAQWFHKGGDMVPQAYGVQAPINMKTVKNGLLKMANPPNSLKNGFSFYCRIKFHSWHHYGRIFSFYSHPKKSNGAWEGRLEGYVKNHDHRRDYDQKMSLEFKDENWRRGSHRRRRHQRTQFQTTPVPRDEEMQLLFTMTSKKMAVWRNSVEIGTVTRNLDWDATPEFNEVDMWIGKHPNNANFLDAEITDIRVWTREVTWDVAVQGSAPDDPDQKPPVDDGADVEVPCISSKLNSYDFACQSDLSEELAKQLGHEKEYFSKYEQAKFEKRAKMGDITICSYKASTKGVVFAGKFGDGLTAEYYRMSTNCHNPPFTFGRVPTVVRVDPTVTVPTDFKAPNNEFAIRWGGKLLIHTAGSYEFELTVNDGAWLAIDSFLTIDFGGCPHPRSSLKTKKSELTKLTAGGHDIAILYFNDGPKGNSLDAKILLKYKGPDTDNKMVPVPTANLGSDPLRLAQLSKDTDKKKNETEVKVTPYGKFIYDEEYNVALMNKGSCDLLCQKGQRKSSAAQFKFFCSETTDVSFVAEVSSDSKTAMIWWDDSKEVGIWSLKSGSLQERSSVLMLQKSAVSMNASTMSEEMSLDHALGMGAFSSVGRDYDLATSSESPKKQVLRGVHKLFFQGRPFEDELFALKYLQFVKGKDVCKFYLEGKDTHFDQC